MPLLFFGWNHQYQNIVPWIQRSCVSVNQTLIKKQNHPTGILLPNAASGWLIHRLTYFDTLVGTSSSPLLQKFRITFPCSRRPFTLSCQSRASSTISAGRDAVGWMDVSRHKLLRLFSRDRGSLSADAWTHCYKMFPPSMRYLQICLFIYWLLWLPYCHYVTIRITKA